MKFRVEKIQKLKFELAMIGNVMESTEGKRSEEPKCSLFINVKYKQIQT